MSGKRKNFVIIEADKCPEPGKEFGRLTFTRVDEDGLRRRPLTARVHFCRECGAKRVGHSNPKSGVGPSGIVYGVYNPFRQAELGSACLRTPLHRTQTAEVTKTPLVI